MTFIKGDLIKDALFFFTLVFRKMDKNKWYVLIIRCTYCFFREAPRSIPQLISFIAVTFKPEYTYIPHLEVWLECIP